MEMFTNAELFLIPIMIILCQFLIAILVDEELDYMRKGGIRAEESEKDIRL